MPDHGHVFTLLLGCCLAAGCAAIDHTHPAPDAPRAAAARPPRLKIGFVNVKRALEDYKKTELENERLQALGTKLREKVAAIERREAELVLRLEDPRTRGFDALKKQILKLRGELKFEKTWANHKLGAEYAKATTEVYADLRGAIRTLAESEGYDVVYKTEPDTINADELIEVNVAINGRAVLYHKAADDLTDAIIRRLNAKYE